MKNTKANRVLAILLLALSLLLTVGVMTVFKPCGPKEDGSWMNCHYAGRNVMFVGLGLCAVSLLRLALKRWRIALDALQLALAVLALLIPGHIMHLCMMDAMRCNAIMKPSVALLSAFIALAALIDGCAGLAGRGKG